MSGDIPKFSNPIEELIKKKPTVLQDPIKELIIDENPFKRLMEVEAKITDPIKELIIDKKKEEEKERRIEEKEEKEEKNEIDLSEKEIKRKKEIEDFHINFEKEVYGKPLNIKPRVKPGLNDLAYERMKNWEKEVKEERKKKREEEMNKKRKEDMKKYAEERKEDMKKYAEERKKHEEEKKKKDIEELNRIRNEEIKKRKIDEEKMEVGGFRAIVERKKREKEEKEEKEKKEKRDEEEFGEINWTNNVEENNINKIMREIINHYETTILAMDEMDLVLEYRIYSKTSCNVNINRNGGYFLQALNYVVQRNPDIPIVIVINAIRPMLKNGNIINEEVRLVFSGTEEFINGVAIREHIGDEENDDGWNLYEENDVGVVTKAVPPGKFLQSIEIWVPDKTVKRKRINGAFIPYCLKEENINLKGLFERYDIYTVKESLKSGNTNCFYICCKNSNLFTEDELIFIKSQINDHFVAFTKLEKIFVKLNVKIIMNYFINGKIQTKYVNKNGLRVMKIYMIRLDGFSHYFINELINSPYEDVKGKITSHELITLGIERGVLEKMGADILLRTKLGLIDKINIELPKDNILFSREIKCEDKGESKSDNIYFADLECITSGEKHCPFCGIIQQEKSEDVKEFYGLDCCERILNYVVGMKRKGRIIIYFHNLSYDGRFFAKFGIISSIEKDSKIYSMTLRYKEKIILLKDSYAIIPTALKNFNSMFDLGINNEKEIYPYNFITKDNIHKGSIEGVGENECPEWDNDKREEFINKLREMKLLNENESEWDVEKYTKYYCRRDVNILRNGYIKFRKMCIDEIKIDPANFLSLSSMAYHYFKLNSFKEEKIYEYTGVVREFMRKAIYGGRCMTQRNKKFIVKDTIVDFDACSLYPSAMSRLYLPTGMPKLIENKTKEWLFEHLMDEKDIVCTDDKFISCFIVTINIKKVNKSLDFPLIVKKVNGVNFNVNENNIQMTVDNIYLEDLIKYQKIEFEIVEGIYWTGNKSTKLSNEIRKVYDLRNKYKREKNAMQNIYKLLMNSSYGKTIQKTILKEIIFKKESELETYWINNYFNIIKGEKIIGSDIYRIEKRCTVDEEYTPIVIGVLILSMSKRIMNELFWCAEEEKINIYYQDTDSIHLKKKDLNILVNKFESVFNRKLIGMEMGQFHTDFENIKSNSTNVVSEKSIFLGKKAYLDCLIDDQGNKKDQVRMKGVPSINIIETAKSYGSCWDLYDFLYDGGIVEFDLIKYGPHFKLYKTMEVESLRCFKRKVRFGEKGEDFINLKREEMINELLENNKTIVANEYMKFHYIPNEIKKKVDFNTLINIEGDGKKFKKIMKHYENLSEYILLMYFCYTTEINEDTIGFIISKLFKCSEIISKLLYPLSCQINYIEELNNIIVFNGITKINNLYYDVISNYDCIMLSESPITFFINEPNDVAKKLLISFEKENN